MTEPTDWAEETLAYDANAALLESRTLWLKLGRACAQWAVGAVDCLDELEWVDRAMAYAARAEACFWRATGDSSAIDADVFIPELRAGMKGQSDER